MWCVLPFFLFSSVNSLSVCFASMYFMCTHIVCRAQYNNKEEAKKNNNQLYRINLCAAGRQCTQITHTCTRYTTIHTLQTFLSEFTIFKFIASLFAIFVSFLYQSLTLTLTASEHCEPIVNAPVQLASFIAALIRSLLSAHVPILWGFEREKYFDCENETHTSSSFSPFLCTCTLSAFSVYSQILTSRYLFSIQEILFALTLIFACDSRCLLLWQRYIFPGRHILKAILRKYSGWNWVCHDNCDF